MAEPVRCRVCGRWARLTWSFGHLLPSYWGFERVWAHGDSHHRLTTVP